MDFIFFDTTLMFEFDNGSHGTYKVSDPDGIQSINGSYRVIIFNDYNSPISCGGVAYSDDFPEGTTPGKVFAMTISFETIIGDSIRTIVMEEVLDFLNNCDVSIKPVEIPQTAVLNSPYPNPFNPRTAIGVQLSAVSDMNLSIYNLAWQKVHTLVSGIKDAGNYKFIWNAQDQASSICLCVMKVNGISAVLQKISACKIVYCKKSPKDSESLML